MRSASHVSHVPNFPRFSGPSSCPPCAHFYHVFFSYPAYKHTVSAHRMTSFLSRRCCIKSPVAPAALHCRNSVSVSLSVMRVWFASKPAHRRANIITYIRVQSDVISNMRLAVGHSADNIVQNFTAAVCRDAGGRERYNDAIPYRGVEGLRTRRSCYM